MMKDTIKLLLLHNCFKIFKFFKNVTLLIFLLFFIFVTVETIIFFVNFLLYSENNFIMFLQISQSLCCFIIYLFVYIFFSKILILFYYGLLQIPRFIYYIYCNFWGLKRWLQKCVYLVLFIFSITIPSFAIGDVAQPDQIYILQFVNLLFDSIPADKLFYFKVYIVGMLDSFVDNAGDVRVTAVLFLKESLRFLEPQFLVEFIDMFVTLTKTVLFEDFRETFGNLVGDQQQAIRVYTVVHRLLFLANAFVIFGDIWVPKKSDDVELIAEMTKVKMDWDAFFKQVDTILSGILNQIRPGQVGQSPPDPVAAACVFGFFVVSSAVVFFLYRSSCAKDTSVTIKDINLENIDISESETVRYFLANTEKQIYAKDLIKEFKLLEDLYLKNKFLMDLWNNEFIWVFLLTVVLLFFVVYVPLLYRRWCSKNI